MKVSMIREMVNSKIKTRSFIVWGKVPQCLRLVYLSTFEEACIYL